MSFERTMVKQVVILAAGYGTRLRPITETTPKIMVPVLGKPLLEWHIRQFQKHGVEEFFINLHYLPDVVRSYFGDGSKFGVKIQYSYEKEILGTAGGLKKFEDSLNQDFFFIFGDVFSLVDYTRMQKEFQRLPDDSLGMMRVGENKVLDADMAELNKSKKFLALYPKPHTKNRPGAYRLRGICVLRKKILSYIPKNTRSDFYVNLLSEVISSGGRFYGYECDEYSKGIDTKKKLREVEDRLKQLGVTFHTLICDN